MTTINTISINVVTLIATVKINIANAETCNLFIVLSTLSYTNHTDIENIVESLDWSNAQPNKDYHLESGVLTETPASPGITYQFDYTTNTWRDTRTQEQMWQEVRSLRDELLKASDWTQMPDVAIATKSDWAVYRQALRDVTNQSDPFNITWPMPPGA